MADEAAVAPHRDGRGEGRLVSERRSLGTSEPVTRHQFDRVILGLLILGIALGAVIPLERLLRLPGDTTSKVLAAVLLCCGVGGGGLVLCSRGDRWAGLATFRLGPWWIIKYLVLFAIASIGWVNSQPTGGLAIEPLVPAAILLCAAGLAAWIGGYLAGTPALVRGGLRHLINSSLPPKSWQPLGSTPAVVFGIGVAATAAQIALGHFGYLENVAANLQSPSPSAQFLSILSNFTLYGLILATMERALNPTIRSRTIFIAILGLDVALDLASGVKEEFLWTFLGVVIVYSVLTRRIPVRAIAISLAVAILIFPINLVYREQVRQGTGTPIQGPVASIAQLPSIVHDVLFEGPPLTQLPKDSFEAVAHRLRDIDSVAVIMARTPAQIPFLGVAALPEGVATGLIPRLLWPNKPALDYGYQFSQVYLGLGSDVYTSTAITPPGDLYRYGGSWLVIVGMFIYGSIARLFEDNTYPRARPELFLLYIPLFIQLTNLEADVVGNFLGLVETFVALLLVSRVVFFRRRRRAQREARLVLPSR